jgi:hypothetical protein
MPDELEVLGLGEESQNFAIEVQELFLRGNAATAQFLLEVFEQLRVFVNSIRLHRDLKRAFRAGGGSGLGLAEVLEELASVSIAVVDADRTAAQAQVETDLEIRRLKRHLRAILLDDHLTLEEDALEAAGVGLLRLDELDRAILKVVEDDQLTDAVVLQARLNNGFLEVTVETKHLLVELGEGGLKELVDLSADVVRVLDVRKALAFFDLRGQEVLLDCTRESVQRNWHVLGVAERFEFGVRNLLKGGDSGIVGWHVTG